MSGGPLGPTSTGERLVSMDAVRGVALLGILVVNVHYMGLPLGRLPEVVAMLEIPRGDRIAWTFVELFFEYKFVSTFSTLFGMGLAMQWARARDRRILGVQVRRLLLLVAIGFVHAIGLWYGDILFTYGLAGLIVLLVRRWPTGVVLGVGLGIVVASIGLTALLTTVQGLQPPPEPAVVDAAGLESSPPRGLDAVTAVGLNPWDPVWVDAETHAVREGPLGDVLLFRGLVWLMMMLFAVLISGFGLRTLGMMIVGVALFRAGFFEARGAGLRRRLALIALPAGFVLEVGAVGLATFVGKAPGSQAGLVELVHGLGSYPMALGLMGLLGILFEARPRAALTRLCAAAGRTALTVYLGETILLAFVFQWWGLGRFGDFSMPQLLLFAPVTWLVLAIAATLWLRRFRMGPFEWAWRWASYGRRPRLRRDPVPVPEEA